MKLHLKHLAMCAPVIVLGVVLIATGTGVVAVLPIAACVLMMGAMMAVMGRLSKD